MAIGVDLVAPVLSVAVIVFIGLVVHGGVFRNDHSADVAFCIYELSLADKLKVALVANIVTLLLQRVLLPSKALTCLVAPKAGTGTSKPHKNGTEQGGANALVTWLAASLRLAAVFALAVGLSLGFVWLTMPSLLMPSPRYTLADPVLRIVSSVVLVVLAVTTALHWLVQFALPAIAHHDRRQEARDQTATRAVQRCQVGAVGSLKLVLYGGPKVGKTSVLKALLEIDPSDAADERNGLLVVSRTPTVADGAAATLLELPGHDAATLYELSSSDQLRGIADLLDVGIYVANANSPPLDHDEALLHKLANRCRIVLVVLTHAGHKSVAGCETVRREWQESMRLSTPPFLTEITGYDNAERVRPVPWRMEGVPELRSAILNMLHTNGATWRMLNQVTINSRSVAELIGKTIAAMMVPAWSSDANELERIRVRTTSDIFNIYFPGRPEAELSTYSRLAMELLQGADDGVDHHLKHVANAVIIAKHKLPSAWGFLITVMKGATQALAVTDAYLRQPYERLQRELFGMVAFAVVCINPRISRRDWNKTQRILQGRSWKEMFMRYKNLVTLLSGHDSLYVDDALIETLNSVRPVV